MASQRLIITVKGNGGAATDPCVRSLDLPKMAVQSMVLSGMRSGYGVSDSRTHNARIWSNFEWIVGDPDAMPTIQLFGSMPMRSLTAPRIRCLQPR